MQLRYLYTDEPGLSRRRCGRSFVLHSHGGTVRDARLPARVDRHLAAPEAYAGAVFAAAKD